jgi:hypothetical protein
MTTFATHRVADEKQSDNKKKKFSLCVPCMLSLRSPYKDDGDLILADMTKQSKHHNKYQHI